MEHYRKLKGYRRYPGRDGRPVYFVSMSRQEVNERRVLFGVIGTLVALAGTVVFCVVSMV